MKHRILTAVLTPILGLVLGGAVRAASTNGSAGDMPAFYDCEPITINFKPSTLDPSHKQINIIYFQDVRLPGTQPMVIDQITGQENSTPPKNGFNPNWLGMQIVFNAGFTPHQFCSDNDIVPASQGTNPEITLVNTGQVYRCAVVGKR